MGAINRIQSSALICASVVSLVVLGTACDSQEQGRTDIKDDAATAMAPADAAIKGDSARCQPRAGGPPPIFGELARYSLALQKRRMSDAMSKADTDAAMQALQTANSAMANQKFDEACTIADKLKERYEL